MNYLVQVCNWIHGLAVFTAMTLFVALLLAFFILADDGFPVGDSCKGPKLTIFYGLPIFIVAVVLTIFVPYGDVAKELFTHIIG